MSEGPETYELVEGDLGAARVEEEPPGVSSDSRKADVGADDHVAEEQPLPDDGLTTVARVDTHDAVVRRVEAERGGGQTVGDQVYPKQLDGDQSLGHAEQHSQKDADNFADI